MNGVVQVLVLVVHPAMPNPAIPSGRRARAGQAAARHSGTAVGDSADPSTNDNVFPLISDSDTFKAVALLTASRTRSARRRRHAAVRHEGRS
ncbi:hypothetical protein J1792_31855 [Streptomyces triculaminicus]|uniref:Uncharacterized protein n=3 Tax=Streptomyces TaxID=1883 RepID=A0A939FRK8_9ACTN|nr:MULTISPECIES: hypothetical protein [Streptomyces]MBO0657151.1 hypothetical protein [Streptomyces triculaminicus]QSY49458.1 hypothetical protein J3S04_31900 [Streptomyces griseocarneus]